MELSLYGLRTIILENEKIRIMFLLDKGTEIIEFVHKETNTDFYGEVLMNTSRVKARTKGSWPFLKGEMEKR